MSVDDQKTKKRWLYSFLCLIFGSFFYELFANPTLNQFPLLFGSILMAASSLGVYLYFRCAYKKPGTRLLTLAIVGSILSLISTPLLIAYRMNFTLESQGLFIAFIFIQVGSIWMLYMHFIMRRLNKKLQTVEKT